MLGFQGKTSRFYFSFSPFLFLFLLDFSFFSFLEDNIGLQIRVTRTYTRLPTYVRPALQSERRYTNSQLIDAIWSVVCELSKGGNFQVEHAGTLTEQKLTQAWNLF